MVIPHKYTTTVPHKYTTTVPHKYTTTVPHTSMHVYSPHYPSFHTHQCTHTLIPTVIPHQCTPTTIIPHSTHINAVHPLIATIIPRSTHINARTLSFLQLSHINALLQPLSLVPHTSMHIPTTIIPHINARTLPYSYNQTNLASSSSPTGRVWPNFTIGTKIHPLSPRITL